MTKPARLNHRRAGFMGSNGRARPRPAGGGMANRLYFRAAMLPLLLAGILAACDTAPERAAEPAPAASAPTAEPPALPAMAITIDDLPWIGTVHAGEDVEAALGRMIAALTERGVPAAAYANCERAGTGAPRLRQWVDAGLELGNHSAAHLDLNTADLAAWLRDVRSCHRLVREITGDERNYTNRP